MRIAILLVIICAVMTCGARCFAEEGRELNLWRAYYNLDLDIAKQETILRDMRHNGVELMGRLKELGRIEILRKEEKKKADQAKEEEHEG